ncbi:MAG: hydantoinase/oxoprolinase family protein [Candidatus Bathyarchaeia archaeon]
MARVLGLDIGGANTKAAAVQTKEGGVFDLRTAMEYFPFWKRDTAQLSDMLERLKQEVSGNSRLDGVGLTMTAELSDAYRTKREGVSQILDCASNVFGEASVLVANADTQLVSVDSARANPLSVAGANWAATGWMVSRLEADCVVVDVGSTSTSIIPVAGGRVAAAGRTDLEKLINGELVYTGSLRTNVAATMQSVPLRGRMARISSELFAQSGDVHLVLGNIKPEQYTVETPDNKGKTRAEALARLARVVCADVEMLTEEEIVQIAAHAHATQVEQIAEALNQVYSRLGPKSKAAIPIIATGLGKDFLAKRAAEKARIANIRDMTELLGARTALVSPAVAAALMAAERVEGKSLKWKL